MSDRNKAFELQERLQENGISDTTLLDFIINNYSSGSYALGIMQSALIEFGLEKEEDDEVDGSSWRESEDFFNEDEEDYNSALLYGVDNNQ